MVLPIRRDLLKKVDNDIRASNECISQGDLKERHVINFAIASVINWKRSRCIGHF